MEYNHFTYGEYLAKSLKHIAHDKNNQRFFRATEQEEFEELSDRVSTINSPIRIGIDGQNSDLLWQADNMSEQPQYFFVILKPTESDDTDTIFQTQRFCKGIAKQIVSRMLNDRSLELNGLETLDRESFVIRGVGPMGDNFYGILIGFNLVNTFEYTINDDYWL